MKFPQIKINLKSPNFYLNLVFVLFLLLAFYFRFYHFNQTYDWGPDNVRDFLVVKHIVKDHDFQWISPWAAGSSNSLVNSVFYYYFLAIFYLVSFGSILAYQIIIALFFLIIVLVFSYLLAKILFKDKLSQYLTVLLFCFLPVMNLYGRTAFQPHFVLPILLMSIYYFLLSFKKKSIKYLSLAVLFYFIGLNIHYSLLVISPWIVFMTIYLQYTISYKAKDGFKFKSFLNSQFHWPSLIIFLSFYFFFINQMMIKGLSNGSSSILSFLHKTFIVNLKFYFGNVNNNFFIFGNTLLGKNAPQIAIILLCLLALFIFVLFLLKKKTFYSVSLFMSLLFFPLIFLEVYFKYGGRYPTYYFSSFYILLPVFLLSVLASLANKFRKIIFLIFFSLILFLSCFQFIKIKIISNKQQIERYELIASIIHDDAVASFEDATDFYIFTIDDQLDWASPLHWFYLERKFNLKLTENTWYRSNVVTDREKINNIYLICDNPRVSWDIGRQNLCIERLVKKKMVKTYEKILSIESQNLSIYRVILNDSIGRYSIYGEISRTD